MPPWHCDSLNQASLKNGDGLKSDALIQRARVIVNAHREQARSYSGFRPVTKSVFTENQM